MVYDNITCCSIILIILVVAVFLSGVYITGKIMSGANSKKTHTTFRNNKIHHVVELNKGKKYYCESCGDVLPNTSFLGYTKCTNCGKRNKIRNQHY